METEAAADEAEEEAVAAGADAAATYRGLATVLSYQGQSPFTPTVAMITLAMTIRRFVIISWVVGIISLISDEKCFLSMAAGKHDEASISYESAATHEHATAVRVKKLSAARANAVAVGSAGGTAVVGRRMHSM